MGQGNPKKEDITNLDLITHGLDVMPLCGSVADKNGYEMRGKTDLWHP